MSRQDDNGSPGPDFCSPLYSEFFEAWESYLKLPADSSHSYRTEDAWVMEVQMDNGMRLRYSQKRLDGENYLDTLIINMEGSERSFSFRFSSTGNVDDGRLHLEEPLGPAEAGTEYPLGGVDISRAINDVLAENKRLQTAANFAEAFSDQFRKVLEYGCEFVFMINRSDFAYLGDQEVIETVRKYDFLIKGVSEAYLEHSGRMQNWTIRDPRAALREFPDGSRVALLTRSSYAPELILILGSEADSIEGDVIRIGEKEIVLIGYNEMTAEDFMDSVFSTSVYDVLAKIFNKGKPEIMDLIKAAEASPFLRKKEQLDGIRKSLEERVGTSFGRVRLSPDELMREVEVKTGRSLEKVLGIDTAKFFESVTAEFEVFREELYVYRKKVWWDVLKEHVGMVSEMSLVAPQQEPDESYELWALRHSEWQKRQEDWRRRVFEAYSLFLPQIRGVDYDMFLYISPERHAKGEKSELGHIRRGVGNMIVDLGDSELRDWINFNAPDLSFEMAKFYEEHRGDMNTYLFRGQRVLKPMLRKLFSDRLPNGGSVVVATCSDKLKELADFCRILDDGALMYGSGDNAVRITVLDTPEDYNPRVHTKLIL
ncbi:hypothetical protein KY359_06800 [Candidatus Woesearchaeota archaeon]|nr:hypothetical protein [Candidatus Woesearchaeota archaeon]